MSQNQGHGTAWYACWFDSYEAAENAIAARFGMSELPDVSMGGIVVGELIMKWNLPQGSGGWPGRWTWWGTAGPYW